MALLFLDGMGYYDTPYIPRKWTALVQDDFTTWTIEATGREANCLQRVRVDGGTNSNIQIAPLMKQTGPWSPTASGVYGAAYHVNDLGLVEEGGSPPKPFFQVVSGNKAQFTVRLNVNGTFSVVRNDASPTTLAHSIEGVLSDTWFEFEIKWLIHDTTGSIIIRVNRVVILTYTGGTQANQAPLANWNSVTTLGTNRAIDAPSADDLIFKLCDVYLADLSGSGDAIRDFINVYPIDYIKPNGVGNYSQWTPSTGANWQNVDEVPPNTTDYNSATDPATTDSYTFTDIPNGTIVLGIQHSVLARKEDAGGATIQVLTRQGGVDYLSPAQGVPSEEYYMVLQPYDTNPATGVRFTYSEINADEFGVVKES